MFIIFGIITFIILVFAIIGSIAGWLNTKIIIEELALIKKELGIKEDKKGSFLDDVYEDDVYEDDVSEDDGNR